MMRSDEAIVLGCQALGEADVIVTWIDREGAKVRGVARSARSSRRRFGGALEPMSRVTVRWTPREGRDLQRVDGIDLVRSHAAMQAEPEIQAACAVLSEVAGSLTREADDDARVFRLLEAVLDALAAGADPLSTVRYFEYWMLRLHGLLPDLSACAGCQGEPGPGGVWVCESGGIVRCSTCARAVAAPHRKLSPADVAFLGIAASSAPTDLCSAGARVHPGGALESLLRGAIEGFLERRLRTYRHLNAAVLRG